MFEPEGGNLVEGSPLDTVGATSQHLKEKLKNDSESECRSCLY